ncbi:outer membrane lipoprotein chaperone LolA [Arsukibacterium indicum]|uniref:Outer-membrane lipoprotein carrier protein n=1 Tax=Arsukibacterium indicum TaxID=2848612 RepID=A0ABS6MMF6_9GAMM|nr:outer membrane lipoprotein chaperone LolA [Arsukibacterium indicum]MBV2129765.1 outer membrane lipoprotein chaperone LolA [Arsukibacterium indicum]
MKKLALIALLFSHFALAQQAPPADFAPHLKQAQQQRLSAPDGSAELLAELARIDSFSARYQQQVFDQQQQLLQQGQGKLLLKKVAQFRFEGEEPEPVLLVSDGTNLWFYNELLEQVSVYNAQAQVGQTAFALLTTTDPELWQQYQVIAQQEVFIIHPLDTNNPVQQLMLAFNENGISEMTVIDINQQQSVFRFSDARLNPEIDDKQFQFTVPAGVDIDDQRQQ